MGILSIFQSSNKALDIAEKATSGIIAGLDKLKYTEEEMADMRLKVADIHLELMRTTASENTDRSITRRYLAVSVIAFFLFMLLAAGIIWPFNPAWSAKLVEIATIPDDLITGIGFFFFGSYAVNGAIGAFKNK